MLLGPTLPLFLGCRVRFTVHGRLMQDSGVVIGSGPVHVLARHHGVRHRMSRRRVLGRLRIVVS